MSKEHIELIFSRGADVPAFGNRSSRNTDIHSLDSAMEFMVSRNYYTGYFPETKVAMTQNQ